MSLLVKITLCAALILSIGVPFGAFAAGEKTKGRYKTALAANLFLFFGTMVFSAVVMFSGNAQAAEAGAQAAGPSAAGMGYLSAALSTGLSCLGGGIAGLGGLYFVMEYSGGTWTNRSSMLRQPMASSIAWRSAAVDGI